MMAEVLGERRIDNNKVDAVIELPHSNKPYLGNLHCGILPDDLEEARQIKINSPQFSMKGKQLYERGYLAPWLRCISRKECQALLEESHSGEMGVHEGA